MAALRHRRHPAGPQQRGRPVFGAGQRADRRQPPPHQPVPEHGGARPAARVRGRQRAVPGRPDRARQRSRPPAGDDGGQSLMRRRRTRSPVLIGLIALAVILVLVFLGFSKDIPFTKPFEVNATFHSANSIRPGSPVRIAGVEVGKVKEIEADQDNPDAAVVVLQIDDDGLPLHEDATAKIRPRIFLEGNFFVDLRPGSPGTPELEDGDTIKVTQTATPVQLDEILTTLQSDTRQDLKDVLHALAVALNSEPTAADDRVADPSTRGETAAESVNAA